MFRARRLIAVPILCYYFAAHGLPSEHLSTVTARSDMRTAQRLEQTIKEELAQSLPAQLEEEFADDLRVTLNSINIHGASLLGNVELEMSVAKFVGVTMTYEQMFEVAMAVEVYYREHNYLARVVLPTQDISGGVLELEVIESVITLAEVDKKLEEFPNTRTQMDALIGPQQGHEYVKNIHTRGDADVELLLGMYQSRSAATSEKAHAEEFTANFSADVFAFFPDLSKLLERKFAVLSAASVHRTSAVETVSTEAMMSDEKPRAQKFPMWHEPLTRRRRFISAQDTTRQTGPT